MDYEKNIVCTNKKKLIWNIQVNLDNKHVTYIHVLQIFFLTINFFLAEANFSFRISCRVTRTTK